MPKIAYVCIAVFLSGCAHGQLNESFHGEGQYAEVNGTKLWYETKGKGEPLVLVFGGPGLSHLGFHPHFATLADEFQIIYFDAFGTGKSDRAVTPSEYSFTRDVENLEALRRALNIETWSVYGFSYGTIVAQAYALKYPDSLNKLILTAALHSTEVWQAGNDNYNLMHQRHFPDEWEKLSAIRNMGFRSSDPEHQKVYVSDIFFNYFDPDNYQNLQPDYPNYNADVFYQLAGNDADFEVGGDMSDFDFRDQLSSSSMPILIMHGRHDRMVLPKFALQYKQFASDAEFVVFEKSGHGPFREETAKHAETLRQFLRN